MLGSKSLQQDYLLFSKSKKKKTSHVVNPKEATDDTEIATDWYFFQLLVKNKQECYERTIFPICFHYFFFFLKP